MATDASAPTGELLVRGELSNIDGGDLAACPACGAPNGVWRRDCVACGASLASAADRADEASRMRRRPVEPRSFGAAPPNSATGAAPAVPAPPSLSPAPITVRQAAKEPPLAPRDQAGASSAASAPGHGAAEPAGSAAKAKAASSPAIALADTPRAVVAQTKPRIDAAGGSRTGSIFLILVGIVALIGAGLVLAQRPQPPAPQAPAPAASEPAAAPEPPAFAQTPQGALDQAAPPQSSSPATAAAQRPAHGRATGPIHHHAARTHARRHGASHGGKAVHHHSRATSAKADASPSRHGVLHNMCAYLGVGCHHPARHRASRATATDAGAGIPMSDDTGWGPPPDATSLTDASPSGP